MRNKLGGIMNQTFIYYTVLFLIIFITISNLVENYRYSPKKIKNIIGIAFLLQIIRIVSLIALALVVIKGILIYLNM